MAQYDVVIIGGGPGGYNAAIRAGQLGLTARAFRHPRSPLERANDRLLLWLVGIAVPLAAARTASMASLRKSRKVT